jgi:hypothetical protein
MSGRPWSGGAEGYGFYADGTGRAQGMSGGFQGSTGRHYVVHQQYAPAAYRTGPAHAESALKLSEAPFPA